MTLEPTNNDKLPTDVLSLCRAIADRSPIPTAEINPVTKTIRCVNFAFCLLTGKTKDELNGSFLGNVAPKVIDWLKLIDEVAESGETVSSAETAISESGPVTWTYTLWPVMAAENGALGIILQASEANAEGRDAVVLNQALLLGSLRQHELIEAAELLNVQLRAEMAAREKAENALIQSEKLAVAGRMAAVLAHEINNPLSSVMDLVYLLQSINGVPIQALDYLNQADEELRRIAHVVRQTLGFYRESLSPSTFTVMSLFESIVDLLRTRIRSSSAVIDLQGENQPIITARYGELRQVLSNLLLNSLDALEKGGIVAIRARCFRDFDSQLRRIRITVADNGTGIEAAVMHHIFEPFYTTKVSTGNGLGLWVCKQIINRHGGSLQVRSNTLGPRRGTTFSLTLPADI
jgi:signal transduction histidine kinase